MRRRPAAALMATLVLLGACTGTPETPESDPSADPSASDDSLTVGTGADDDAAEPVFHRRIPPAVRARFTPPTAAQWRTETVTVASTDGPQRLRIEERRMPPCGPGGLWNSYDADDDVLDFAQTVRREGRFTVVQHLTLYPDADTARALVGQLEDFAECGRIDGAEVVRGARSGYERDRTLGTLRPRATRSSLATSTLDDGRRVTLVDTVVRRGNAVVLTRVVDPDGPRTDLTVADSHRDLARTATDDAWAVLDELPPEPTPPD